VTFVVLSLALVLGGGHVFATATTHIWAPSTDVQAFNKLHLTADFYAPLGSNPDGSRANAITNAGFTIGLLPFQKLNAEVGFDHKSGLGGLDKHPFYFNAKIGVPEDTLGKSFPAVAVGVYDVGTAKGKTTNNLYYAKLAKTVSLSGKNLGRFSGGAFVGNDDLLLHDGEKAARGVLFAWERPMPEISNKLWICVEYQGTKSAYGAMNYGFSWKFYENVSAIFGYQAYNDNALANTFTVQIDVDF
jgi:hypothetical protein